MAMPFTSQIVCPVLIGRTPHLDALMQFIEQARDGLGQTVLIAGEAGIGKSRLVVEAIKRFRSSAFPAPLILQGSCFEPDSTRPYAPLLDTIRTFFGSGTPEDIAASLGSASPELLRLFPELGNIVPEAVPGDTSALEPNKNRLFQGLMQFFIYLSVSRPVLLLIEDVHWSDDSSLEFLLYLARHISTHPILLLLTYRSEEVSPGLGRLLVGLDRERLANEFTLTRLSRSEIGAMIRSTLALSHPVPSEFLEMISTFTEGNPFFIEEMLKSFITSGEIILTSGTLEFKSPESEREVPTSSHKSPQGLLHIPRSVQLAVQQRLDHLSQSARDLLAFAAVAGRRFDFALLQEVTHYDEIKLLGLVKELISAQLVVEESEDVFAFRHALTQQAVYTDLLARERKALHHTIAMAMERIYSDSLDAHLSDLAYHFYATGEWGKVLEYAPRAGEKAQQLYAPQAAIKHFTHALEAMQHLSRTPSPALYRARGQAYEAFGTFEAARDDYTRALELAGEAHDQVMEWQSLFDLGFLWTGRDYARAGDYLRQALELARTMNNPSILAQTLNRLGNWHTNVEEPLKGQHYHQEALAIFEILSDRPGQASTLDLLSVTLAMSGDLMACTEYYERAIALFRTLENRQRLISCLATRAMHRGNYLNDTTVWPDVSRAECIQRGEEALTLARQIRWRSGEVYALICLTCGLGPFGDYEPALVYAQDGLALAKEIEQDVWITATHWLLGMLALDLLALPKAREHLEQAFTLAKNLGSLFWLRVVTSSLARVLIAQSDFVRAESILGTWFSPDMPEQTIAQRLAWAARAELELALGHTNRALEIIDQLIASAVHIEAGGVISRLWLLHGEALLSLNRVKEAEAMLLAAQEAAREQGAGPLLWRISVSLGRLYQAQARRDEAEEAFAEARTIIEELASNVPDQALRDNFLRCAALQIPVPRPLTPRQEAKQAFGGLTEREREVAALVAQGKSNRALADELFLSERTVGKHVERIMTKLGFTSRAQIAVWAVEKGLAKHID